MSKIFTCLISLFLMSGVLSADVVGFWKTVDEETGKAESIVAIYEYKGKYYGRIIITFDNDGKIQDSIEAPKKRAQGVIGNPFYAGLDILWDLKPQGTKYVNGEILDPQRGRVYDAKIWNDNGKLIVRGELLIFGRNQTWPPAEESDFPPGFKKPVLAELVPAIPKVSEPDID